MIAKPYNKSCSVLYKYTFAYFRLKKVTAKDFDIKQNTQYIRTIYHQDLLRLVQEYDKEFNSKH